jgi:ribosomal protein L32E
MFWYTSSVSINLFVKKRDEEYSRNTKIYYARIDESWRKEEKYRYLEESQHIGNIN